MPFRVVSASVSMRGRPLQSLELLEIPCLTCGFALDWQQPNLKAPDRLLGICMDCGSWHVLDLLGEVDDTLFVLILDGPTEIKVVSGVPTQTDQPGGHSGDGRRRDQP